MKAIRFVCAFAATILFIAMFAVGQDTPETPAAEAPVAEAPVLETPSEAPAPATEPMPEVTPEVAPAPLPDATAMPAPASEPTPPPAPAAAPAPESAPVIPADVQLSSFVVDVTPPLGSPLCFGAVAPAKQIDDPLTARGMILLLKGQKPIALIAVDWVGIANDAHTAWRAAIADAIGTGIERVAVHALHQHDAPGADFGAEALLDQQGLGGKIFNVAFAHEAMQKVAAAAHNALDHTQPVTHFGTGQAVVEQVASNRRILNAEGKVEATRYTSCPDPTLRDAPEGTIDALLRSVSFWNGETPLVEMTFYATHPQSVYGKGGVSWDYPGLARSARERAVPGMAHLHFNGAGGNIGAGKYNDGNAENRYFLAGRMALAMRKAWESTVKQPITPQDIEWRTENVLLPPRAEVNIQAESEALADATQSEARRMGAAHELVWLQRCAAQDPVTLTALRLGNAYLLGMPGELFVEYQLAAQGMAPENFVALAAYADYGPGYICTAKAYEEGGYEAQVYTSRTSPAAEEILMVALKKLLGK